MAPENSHSTWYEIFNSVWTVFAALGLGIIAFVSRDRKRLSAIESMIPPNALKDGDMLVTVKSCHADQRACTNHLLTTELLDTMQVVKRTLALLVEHSERIPQDDKDTLRAELMADRRIHDFDRRHE